MPLKNFEVELNNLLYQAALKRAQDEGKPLDQILAGLLLDYAQGKTGMTTYTDTNWADLSPVFYRVGVQSQITP